MTPLDPEKVAAANRQARKERFVSRTIIVLIVLAVAAAVLIPILTESFAADDSLGPTPDECVVSYCP